MPQPHPPSVHTIAKNRALAETLPFSDDVDFENVRRGFLGTRADALIHNASGRVVWSMAPFAFQADNTPPPDSVNPSLWRQARLNLVHGLFEVTEGIYQVRGFDLSNITFVEGDRGVIVIDPLISAECAAAAIELYREHRGQRPVSAVIYTHSHVDHFGGVLGVLSPEDIDQGAQIIAPEGFLKEAASENVLVGNAMGRRATYMYGSLLPRGPLGHVDAGLGKTVSVGSVALVPPTDSICRTGESRIVDGVEIVFQMTPDAEAPAEMNFHFPKHRALCLAENCTCHLHNILTPRGAQVRDAKSWSRYIDDAIHLFAADSDVLFASHHWPRWGDEQMSRFLIKQRDLYKYVHDQTLRWANHGLGPQEIAERLSLPPSLAQEWHTRDYYGTLNHNAKAVYQRYLGWFDGNPANLHPHPPEAAGRRYVDLAGGAEALLAKARTAFDEGDYRWVAELVNHLVFAEPGNQDARELQARALEQLGYQAESGPWRSFYLSGAQELRAEKKKSDKRPGPKGQIRELPAGELLDSCSTRLNVEAAASSSLAFVLDVSDQGELWRVEVSNAVLHTRPARAGEEVTLRVDRQTLAQLILGEADIASARIEGERAPLGKLIEMLDVFEFWFGIAEP
ncbi:MAG: alkyl sulfatase dimerization domain-containing protein [Hyphomonadaceae bacterium]